MWRLSAQSPAITPSSDGQLDFSVPLPPQRTVSGNEGAGGEGVESCAFSPGGDRLITSHQNGAVRVSPHTHNIVYNIEPCSS